MREGGGRRREFRLLRSRGFWIGILVSAALIGLFLYSERDNLGDIDDAFRDANYALIAASMPVYFLGLWMRTIRWQYLLRPVRRVTTLRLYPVVIIGLMANNLIPARAGELARAYVLGQRERISKTTSLGTIAVDRIFDGVTLVPMMLIVAAFAGRDTNFDVGAGSWTVSLNFAGLGAAMAVLFGIGMAILFYLAFSERGRAQTHALVTFFLPARLEPKIERLLNSFYDGLHALRSPVDLGVAWAMSLVSWMLEATMYFMVARAFGIHEGYHVFLLLTAAANLAIAIVASQGGVGPFEIVVSKTVVAFGAGKGAASAYALGLHALLLFPIIAIGLYLIWSMKLTFGDMLKSSDFENGTGGEPPLPADARTPRIVPPHVTKEPASE